jgi:subtilase family serine protease
MTGGRAFYPYGQDEVSAVFEAIARELKDQYILSFKQDADAKSGKLRKLDVKIKNAGTNVSARTRSGYYY